MKAKFFAVSALVGLMTLGACSNKRTVPNTNVSLTNEKDSISYAYGSSVIQQMGQGLLQGGILKDTMMIAFEYDGKIAGADANTAASLKKEKEQKIADAKKENEATIALLVSGLADGLKAPESDRAYYLGLGIGQQMGENFPMFEEYFFQDTITKINKDVLVAGFASALKDPKIQQVYGSYLQQKDVNLRAKKEQERMKLAAENLEKGKAFLAENGTKEGVKVLPNGIQYKVIEAGNPNGKKPSATSNVNVNYKGSLIDNTVFDSNDSIDMNIAGVIKGWQEIIPMMNEGATWQIFVPAELAYGETGAGDRIAPNSVLVFDITLNKVN